KTCQAAHRYSLRCVHLRLLLLFSVGFDGPCFIFGKLHPASFAQIRVPQITVIYNLSTDYNYNLAVFINNNRRCRRGCALAELLAALLWRRSILVKRTGSACAQVNGMKVRRSIAYGTRVVL